MMRMIRSFVRKSFGRDTVPTDNNFLLSENFSLGEVLKSQTAIRYGIDNRPNREQYKSLQSLCKNVMEPIRKIYGKPIIVTSGLRVLELNRKIGSWDGSQHIKGEAIDFELWGVSLHELWRKIVLSDIPFDQCILEFPPDGWIHVSHVHRGEQRNKITIARKVDGITKYYDYDRTDVINGRYEL